MDFRVLGSLEVADGDRRIDLGAPRERALLALLALNANRAVSRERILEELWPDGAPRTASKVVQVYVTHLRKALGAAREILESRGSGYVLHIAPTNFDLSRFEQLIERARNEEPREKTRTLREALGLWRGPALDEFADEAFVRAEAARLEELRLFALEARIDADLELGGGSGLVPELESLVAAHPLREHFRGQLMLALYRAGRQAEALDVYRDGRALLDEELGLEPGASLRELERAILRQDPDLAPRASPRQTRTVVVLPERPSALEALAPLGEALAGGSAARDLVVAQIVAQSELAAATVALDALRRDLAVRGIGARAAAFSSSSPARDAVRLASQQGADLLLLSSLGDPFAGVFADAFEEATCDVAVLVERAGPPGDGPVVVPFGAFEHDWAALELGVWIATALERQLQLIGATDDGPDGADASRLLADASLVVQHTSGIVPEPLLGARGLTGISALVAGAGLLVIGVSERWRAEGLGATRSALVEQAPAPMLLVRRGLRPGGLAPEATLTRFTWSIEIGA
ncbi:MAG TPA: AfsR/SARP family transcriptional regulator [Gaiellaceae bacterium]|nr:AfsR/SARP family transcriptional regulator [Gaiellaceae bacterium]